MHICGFDGQVWRGTKNPPKQGPLSEIGSPPSGDGAASSWSQEAGSVCIVMDGWKPKEPEHALTFLPLANRPIERAEKRRDDPTGSLSFDPALCSPAGSSERPSGVF